MLAKRAAKFILSNALGRDIERLDVGCAQLVTFDVFDTLIRRSCGNPEAVYPLVGCEAEQLGLLESGEQYIRMRKSAEADARRKAGSNNEVTLHAIYEEMKHIGLDELRAIIELELKHELAVCRPSEPLVTRYNALRESYRVAIVSDTYLPQEFLETILESCGILGYDGLYVSSEHGVMKRDGRLFKKVLNEMGVDPEDSFHIGDHPLADFLVPRKMGMGAFLLRNRNARSVGASSNVNFENEWR